jgi:hypothetical protein
VNRDVRFALAIVLACMGTTCAPGASVQGNIVVHGTALHGDFEDALSVVGRDRCNAGARRTSQDNWEILHVTFGLGASRIFAMPDRVEVRSASYNAKHFVFTPADCRTFEVKWSIEAGQKIWALVALDCTAPDGSHVTGRVSSSDCYGG